jgi:DNA-directed RNA polymerase subunit RPC12/RpoP
MGKHVSYVCAFCGSSAVLMDAWAEWNVERQDWVLHDAMTEAHCRNCDGETSLVEVELAPAS